MDDSFSVATIIFLVLFIIFLIIAIIFIWLYVVQRNNVEELENQLNNQTPIVPVCPACPTCPPNATNSQLFATGTVQGQEITWSCPLGRTIDGYTVLTKGIDGNFQEEDVDITTAITGAIGQQSYILYPEDVLDTAGITPQRSSTQVIFGAFSCNGGPTPPEPICEWGPKPQENLLCPSRDREKSRFRNRRKGKY